MALINQNIYKTLMYNLLHQHTKQVYVNNKIIMEKIKRLVLCLLNLLD